MAKEKEQTKEEAKQQELTPQNESSADQEAIQTVKDYLLSKLSRGLTAGKQIEITKEEQKDALRQFNWDIPVFKKLEESKEEEHKKVLKAVQSLKKQGYKVYLIKIPLRGVKS